MQFFYLLTILVAMASGLKISPSTTRRDVMAKAAAGALALGATTPAFAASAPLFDKGTGRPGAAITSGVFEVVKGPGDAFKSLSKGSEAASAASAAQAKARKLAAEDAKEARLDRIAAAKAARLTASK